MPSALITGGSSGIGLEISKYFIKAGYDLLWVSATDAEIAKGIAIIKSEFPHATIKVKAINLSKADAAQSTYDWVTSEVEALDVLVNNAGLALGTEPAECAPPFDLSYYPSHPQLDGGAPGMLADNRGCRVA